MIGNDLIRMFSSYAIAVGQAMLCLLFFSFQDPVYGFGNFLDWRHRRFVLLLGNQLALVLLAFLVWIAPAEVGPLEICMRFLTPFNRQRIDSAAAG